MFLKKKITKSTNSYLESIDKLSDIIKSADSIVIGAGAGLSTASGFSYDGDRFQKYFSDFKLAYGFEDMYQGGFYEFDSLEETWAYWSRYIHINRYYENVGEAYTNLYKLLKDKNYFILTTNVDHCFQNAGFDKRSLFYMQGDYGLFQCSKPCHKKTYDNHEVVLQMVSKQKDMKIPTDLIPRCPVCDSPMSMNLRIDHTFVEDQGWHSAAKRYNEFITKNISHHTLYLELGVGRNTPGIIKYPFWDLTYQNSKATYACINTDIIIPNEIQTRSIGIDMDIAQALELLLASH